MISVEIEGRNIFHGKADNKGIKGLPNVINFSH